MPNKDGIVSIGFDYKKDLEKMIKDFEAEMNTVSSNTQLSKGMKKQFDNILAEMREFKASMDKELANLGSGKVSQSSFKSFKQTVENKFKGIREDIDRLDLAVATLNDSMGILGKGVDLSKISNDFKNFEDYVTRTNSAVENLIHTLGEQGISLFSFDNRNISDVQSTIRKIDNELKQLDKDTGAEFELFNEKQAQDELNRLSVQLTSTLELMENAKKRMENMDASTEGFKKARGEFALFQLKAASLNDTIEMLYEVTESKDMYIEMDDKSLSMYEKYTDELADNLKSIIDYAGTAKKELSSLLSSQKSPAIKVSSEMNPNSSELATVVTIETTSSELWKKLSPIMEDLQKTLNSNPVVAPVKLVVAPTSVSSAETGNLDVSKGYSKKYQKILAQTGEDAVVDLEGVYKKTFTSVMDAATSYAKETIGKIQEVFDKNRIGVKFDVSQEEIDKIQNFVLSNKDGKKVDISGQITKAKQEVEELNENIEKTAKLLDDTKSKGNVKFDGFDKFTQDVSKSIGKLEELQNILKALQNIEITLAKASGIASITELDNQWANVEKRIINATKLDGSFRKNASVSKIASEYQKYIDMGGTNSIADIDKIKNNKNTLDTIISKAKEFAKQDLSNDSVKELSIELDGIIGKFDELIATVKTVTNALYKIIKQTGVSELDKQWSSITNKFKSIADESGKINLSKQKKDIEELLVMYQRYVNMGGSHTPFDLTDNLETLSKLDKAYKKLNETKPIDNSPTIKSETESFKQIEQSVDSLTKAIGDTKVQAINVEATAMEDAAEREVFAIHAIYENLGLIVDRLKEIKGIKIPKIKVENVDSPVETNISSPIKDTFQGDVKESAESSVPAVKEEAKAMEQVAENAERASKGKDKFAKANKKVKESADSSADSIEKETSALDKKEWDKNVKAIQEYMDANTKLNNLKAQDAGTGKKASEIAYQTKEVEKFEKAALEARATLSSMINPHEAPIDDWNKWLDVMKQFDQATEGSARSVARLEDALRNMAESQEKSFNSQLSSAQSKATNAQTDYDKLAKRVSQTNEYKIALVNYENAIKQLQNKIDYLNANGIQSEDDITELNQLKQAVDNVSKSISKMPSYEKGTDISKSSTVFLRIEELRRNFQGMSKEQKAILNEMENRFKRLGNSINTASAIGELKEFETQLIRTKTATTSLWGAMKDKAFYNFANQLGTMVSFYDVINVFRQASSTVIDLNTQITELAKVSEATSSQIYDDFNSYAEIAKDVGGTISDTISATADWSRNGYNIPDSKELAEVAMIYKNVGDGISIDQANEYLISTLRGFNLEAKDAMSIIDSMNEVANNEPISASGIGEALQRSAAAFNAANTSLQESIALVTSTNSVLQSPEKVGSMWTTVSARIRGAKTELEDAGLETDGMVESTSKLQAMIKGMTGFDILEADGKTFKSIYDIIIGIGDEFQNLSDLDQAKYNCLYVQKCA